MLIMESRPDADHLDRRNYRSGGSAGGGDGTVADKSPKTRYHSWHAHVYGNPPKTPTPHSIADILGWNCGGEGAGEKIDSEDEPLNLTTRDRSPDDCITSSAAEPVLVNGDSNSSRECRTPRRDSPIKSNAAEIAGKPLSRKNAAVKGTWFWSSWGSVPRLRVYRVGVVEVRRGREVLAPS